MKDDKEILEAAIKNAAEPAHDGNLREWVLYCGDRPHAQAILDAARRELARMKGGENWEDSGVEDVAD